LKQLRKIPQQEGTAIRAAVGGLAQMPDCRHVVAQARHQYDYRLWIGRYWVLFDWDRDVRIVEILEGKKRDERTFYNVQIIRDGAGEPAFARALPGLGRVPYSRRGRCSAGDGEPRFRQRKAQVEVASRLGISQSAYAQTAASAHPRKTTLCKVADALGLSLEQLDF
jgi:mRNA-degrading endonuclease RelE of RelBE toxin-antitoxin system